MEQEAFRERSESVKRKRMERSAERTQDEEDSEQEIEEDKSNWRERLEDLIVDDRNKISKTVGLKIMRVFGNMSAQMDKLRLRNAYLSGRLDEREEILDVLKKKETYAEKLKRPTVLNREVQQVGKGNVVLVYPTKEGGNSEDTKKAVKNVIAPKIEGIQIRSIRKVNKGGVAIETGSSKSAGVIKDATKKNAEIRCAEPRVMLPRLQVFDVEREISEEEFKQCLYKQNLEDMGFTENEVQEGIRLRFKSGRKDADVCNWVIEVNNRIRVALLEKGRIYIDYACCKVRDILAVPRCYKCQGYGHLVKYCKREGGEICSHCGETGHNYRDCKIDKDRPCCVQCKIAKKDSGHRVGSMDCPIYVKAVERLVGSTHYNGK